MDVERGTDETNSLNNVHTVEGESYYLTDDITQSTLTSHHLCLAVKAPPQAI